jgi:hypothetical protein
MRKVLLVLLPGSIDLAAPRGLVPRIKPLEEMK